MGVCKLLCFGANDVPEHPPFLQVRISALYIIETNRLDLMLDGQNLPSFQRLHATLRGVRVIFSQVSTSSIQCSWSPDRVATARNTRKPADLSSIDWRGFIQACFQSLVNSDGSVYILFPASLSDVPPFPGNRRRRRIHSGADADPKSKSALRNH